MGKSRLLILAAILGMVSNTPNARAGFVTAWVDGVSADVPVHWVSDAGNNGLGAYVIGADGQDKYTWTTTDTVNGGEVKLSGELDADPSLIFGGTVTDFGAPSIFSFTYILPIVPVSNPSVVLDSFSGSVTNGAAN